MGLLGRTSRHLNAREIFGVLAANGLKIGLTTVYRTLGMLDKAGAVNKVKAGDGHVRYELKSGTPEDHHHHLICMHCGRIIDYRDFEADELELVRKTEAVLARKHRFQIYDHNIEFVGVCEKCQAKLRRLEAKGDPS